MVHVPGKGGAMENWGLVLYSKDTLMFDVEENDVEKRWRVLEVVAHELAHMWTGNLVTMKWSVVRYSWSGVKSPCLPQVGRDLVE